MTMTDAQMAELGPTVGPRLDRQASTCGRSTTTGRTGPGRRGLRTRPEGFDGAAFHCYGGRPAQMAGLGVPRLVTECTGTTDGFAGTFAWDARNLVAGAVAAGSSGLMMWSLALDAEHGPSTPARRTAGRTAAACDGDPGRGPQGAGVLRARAISPGRPVPVPG